MTFTTLIGSHYYYTISSTCQEPSSSLSLFFFSFTFCINVFAMSPVTLWWFINFPPSHWQVAAGSSRERVSPLLDSKSRVHLVTQSINQWNSLSLLSFAKMNSTLENRVMFCNILDFSPNPLKTSLSRAELKFRNIKYPIFRMIHKFIWLRLFATHQHEVRFIFNGKMRFLITTIDWAYTAWIHCNCCFVGPQAGSLFFLWLPMLSFCSFTGYGVGSIHRCRWKPQRSEPLHVDSSEVTSWELLNFRRGCWHRERSSLSLSLETPLVGMNHMESRKKKLLDVE